MTGDPKSSVCIVSLDGSRIVGVFLGALSEVTFSDTKIATELAFWLLPGYRKSRRIVDMLSAFEYWAKHIAGVEYLVTAETPHKDKTPRSYSALGYKLIENYFLKKVS